MELEKELSKLSQKTDIKSQVLRFTSQTTLTVVWLLFTVYSFLYYDTLLSIFVLGLLIVDVLSCIGHYKLLSYSLEELEEVR